MAELTAELLTQVLAHTLEEAAFVFAEPTDQPPPHEEPLIEARLKYHGEHEAELVLATSGRFAATIAANLLGEDEGGADVIGDDHDALGELLNMIAGALVAELFGPDSRCRLGLPAVGLVRADEHLRALAAAHAAVSMVDEGERRIDLSARMV